MSSAVSNVIKTKAAFSVLSRLGDQMFIILEAELRENHSIRLDDGAFTLEELQLALQKALDDGAAKWLMLEIVAEIEYLTNDVVQAENLISVR